MKRFVTILIVLGGLLLGAFGGWQFVLSPVDPSAGFTEFEIESGWSGQRIATALAEHGFVRSPEIVQLYLKIEAQDRSLGEGLYDISASQSVPEIIETLMKPGRPREVALTFPEGWRADQILTRMSTTNLWSVEELTEAANSPASWAPDWLPETVTGVEGYLFPDTYHIPEKYTAEQALELLVARFHDELTEDVLEAIAAEGLTLHEWVVLASVVQAEAASDAEMPVITGVFLNRLALGMPLQSDPTAVYESRKPLNELTAADLRIPSPWNTYTEPRLPLGPINNPGSAALKAILYPVKHDENGNEYLYFLHGTDDGVPVFRPNTSLSAHNQDIDRFLR